MITSIFSRCLNLILPSVFTVKLAFIIAQSRLREGAK